MTNPDHRDRDRRFMPPKQRRPRTELLLAVAQIEQMDYQVAGSFRREKPDIGDLDILIPPHLDFGESIEQFQEWFQYKPIRQGGMKSEGLAMYNHSPLLLNLWRIPTPQAYAALLLFATGPYDLNIAMRARAKTRGLLLSQYGLFEPKLGNKETQDQLDSGQTEEEIFTLLKYEYLSPVERENWKGRIRIKLPLPKTSVYNIPSSKGTSSYQVEVNSQGNATQCDCMGFTYRQKCRHLTEAEALWRKKNPSGAS